MGELTILVADDDRELCEILTFALSRAGYDVVRASDGEQALALFAAHQPSLVLLDYAMPKRDGLQVCQRLRAQSAVPIIMLTVRNQEEDILRAFELGADDYVSKPFSPKQLIARVKAALRRAPTSATDTWVSGDVQLDAINHAVTRAGIGTIDLTPLEYRLLHVLLQQRGQALSAEVLVEQVWGHDAHVADRTLLKGLVRRVRQKVDVDSTKPSLIKTVAGVGYMVAA